MQIRGWDEYWFFSKIGECPGGAFPEVGETRYPLISAWADTVDEHRLGNPSKNALNKQLAELGVVCLEGSIAYEENLRLSERAAKEYALTEHAPRIEAAMGKGNSLKLTAQLGRGPGEHAFAAGGAPQFGITKEESVEQIGALTRDRDFIKRYLSGDHVPKLALRPQVLEELRAILHAPNKHTAQILMRQVVETYSKSATELASWLESNVPEGFTVFDLPPEHWVKMRTSNMIERVNQELKRRTRVIRVFPNIASLLRLITARLCEISDS